MVSQSNSVYARFLVFRFRCSQAIMMWLHTSFKMPLAIGLVLFGVVLRSIGIRRRGLGLVLKARRIANVQLANSIIKNIIKQGQGTAEFSGLLVGELKSSIELYKDRILILKLPSVASDKVIEKGAIILKFTETFTPIYQALDVHLLSKYFHVILEPSWVGNSAGEILIWESFNSSKVIVFSPDDGDFQFLSELDSNLIPLNLGAADWVDPRVFHEIENSQKIYDSLYIANFNSIKRVDRYIRAVVSITRDKKDFSAALVCAGHGNAQREIMAMLQDAQGKSNITFFKGMPQSDLNKLINNSKLNVLLSLKEGANKGLTEGLFSGTPALLLEENVGVKRASINEQTGKIVSDSKLEDALIWFSNHFQEFQSREWAVSHVAPEVSSKTLSNKLKEIAISEGGQWNKDVFVKVNQPELSYLDLNHDWLLSKRKELLKVFSLGTDERDIIDFIEGLEKTI